MSQDELPPSMVQWYFADRGERFGPFAEEALREKEASGELTPDTMVWRTGFADWRPLGDALDQTPPESGMVCCVMTGKWADPDEMLSTEHGWVSAEAKENYLAGLREGISPIDREVRAWRDGRRVVVRKMNPRLPHRCVLTNEPVVDADLRKRKLYWASPWIWLSILINILIALIVYLLVRRKVEMTVPMGTGGRALLLKHRLIALGLLVAGVVAAFSISVHNEVALVWGGVGMILTGLIWFVAKGQGLVITKIKGGNVWLSGACEAYCPSGVADRGLSLAAKNCFAVWTSLHRLSLLPDHGLHPHRFD